MITKRIQNFFRYLLIISNRLKTIQAMINNCKRGVEIYLSHKWQKTNRLINVKNKEVIAI